MNIKIDFSEASAKVNELWRGMGMVSANNSSRLLMDYKVLHPESYKRLLELMFGKTGLCIEHLKIEMGADINSSSGTEPCTMRTSMEKADVTRGAGFMLCADAKKINPNLTLDMLWWGEPLWIEESENVYESRYQWYKNNLTEAYNVYKLKFDFVSATQNERGWDSEWIKYLSNRLKTDNDTVYDFSKIKIVAGEEVCTWNTADLMINDQDLCDAVDVIGSHYTSWCTDNVLKLRQKGKEVWLSEGSSPMGTSFENVLDVANRIITMFACGRMTLYEIQPVVASYYDGVTYSHKQLITANTPWNGYYDFTPGFFMTLHFSQFFPREWSMLESASFADGKPAGDGHGVGEATYSYMTGCNPKTGDFSSVITNTTSEAITYNFTLENAKKVISKLYLYETASEKTDEALIKLEVAVSDNQFSISIKPNSLITITTLDKTPLEDLNQYFLDPEENAILKLPYSDDFSYSQYKTDFLTQRGGAPLFTSDEGGAFEVVDFEEGKALKQIIQREKKNKEWGWTADPVTNFGDDRWFNYSVAISAKFGEERRKGNNYVGVGLRYNLPDCGKNGLWLQLFNDGKWSLNRNNESIKSGLIDSFDNTIWHRLFILAEDNFIDVKVDEIALTTVNLLDTDFSLQGAGRAAIFSDYEINYFKDLEILPAGDFPYIERFGNLSSHFEYVQTDTSHWDFGLLESFKIYNRSASKGKEGSIVKIKFNGTGFNLCGNCPEACLSKIKIDNQLVSEKTLIRKTGNRECLISASKLENKLHLAEIEFLNNQVIIDSLELRLK